MMRERNLKTDGSTGFWRSGLAEEIVVILLWGSDERGAPDEKWVREWTRMGLREMQTYLKRQAQFDDYLRRTGR